MSVRAIRARSDSGCGTGWGRPERPYRERQWIPGDHDAQVSQGPINVHALEHLGTQDRGIVMFRRFARRSIQAVEKGQDPKGLYMRRDDVPPTFANASARCGTTTLANLARSSSSLTYAPTKFTRLDEKPLYSR